MFLLNNYILKYPSSTNIVFLPDWLGTCLVYFQTIFCCVYLMNFTLECLSLQGLASKGCVMFVNWTKLEKIFQYLSNQFLNWQWTGSNSWKSILKIFKVRLKLTFLCLVSNVFISFSRQWKFMVGHEFLAYCSYCCLELNWKWPAKLVLIKWQVSK